MKCIIVYLELRYLNLIKSKFYLNLLSKIICDYKIAQEYYCDKQNRKYDKNAC